MEKISRDIDGLVFHVREVFQEYGYSLVETIVILKRRVISEY
jgi:hypothetical protein